MSDFYHGGSAIHQEQAFKNPTLRFIRRNGRIVPIINRQKVGEKVAKYGLETAATGGVVAGAGLAARALQKQANPKVAKAVTTTAKKVGFAIWNSVKEPHIIKAKKARPGFEVARKAVDYYAAGTVRKFGRYLTHPIRTGAIIGATGLAAAGLGAYLQMGSRGLDVGAEHGK